MNQNSVMPGNVGMYKASGSMEEGTINFQEEEILDVSFEDCVEVLCEKHPRMFGSG